MLTKLSRRELLGTLALLPAAAAAGPALKVSLNAYSFNALLTDGHSLNLMGVLEFAAKRKFDGIDATGYYFPGYPAPPPDSFLDEFKRRAAALNIGISGTGVRNNFTTSDKAIRDASVQHIQQWIQVAARLGAPVVRVFADTQMRNMTWEMAAKGYTRAQVQEWIAADLRECADYGKRYGVRIGVQNHGDFLKTGPELLSLIDAAGSPWCGPIVDIGSFKTQDPYADIALVAPRAINWQIKTSPFGNDSEVRTDLVRLMKIIRGSGYAGYLPIETLSPKGKPYDPYVLVPEFLKQVREAIAATEPAGRGEKLTPAR